MEKILYNGRIYSLDDGGNRYTALGIENGKIAFLGTDEEALCQRAETTVNLNGETVLPGFIDSHLHMLNYAFVEQSYRMSGVKSISQIIDDGKQIVREMEGQDPNQWIYGRGWDENIFTDEKRPLTRMDLDKISTDRPILFIRNCGHKAAVNTKALEMVLSLEKTKDYLYQIDAGNGILTEASVKMCYNTMEAPTVEQIKEMILLAQKKMNACGITGVETDNFLSLPGMNIDRIMEAYRQLEADGLLTLRVREQASFTCFSDMKSFIDRGYRTGMGGEFYTIGPVKLYEDGSLGARTALMNEPYMGTEQRGTAVHDAKDTAQLVDYAYSHGMQILIHAIGDKASDMVCDAYIKAIKKYGKRDSRLAINHLQVISESLLDKMKQYGILAYIQPVFVAGDQDLVARLLGNEVADRSYMWKTMFDKGIICCGGSDSPVESFDILRNIQIAVTRDKIGNCTSGWYPDQKLNIDEAVRLFTKNNAYGAFAENRRGTIELGKDADLTVLKEDIFEAEHHNISNIGISATIVAGKEVYSSRDGEK